MHTCIPIHPSIFLRIRIRPASVKHARTHTHAARPTDRPPIHLSVTQAVRRGKQGAPLRSGQGHGHTTSDLVQLATSARWSRQPNLHENPPAWGPGAWGWGPPYYPCPARDPSTHRAPAAWHLGVWARSSARTAAAGGQVGKAKRERRREAEELRHHPKAMQLVSRRSDMRQTDRPQPTTHRSKPRRLGPIKGASGPVCQKSPRRSIQPRPAGPSHLHSPGRKPRSAAPKEWRAWRGVAAPRCCCCRACSQLRNWAMGGTPPRSAAGSRPGRVIARRATQ